MLVRLIRKLRSWKRSCQRTQLELKQQAEVMERATGLHFYILKKPMPCTLAVARYSSWADIDDLHTRIFDISEVAYPDAYESIGKLEYEVMEALHCGVDVVIATAEEISTFPRLAALITHDLT
jgi:hypothetical protein